MLLRLFLAGGLILITGCASKPSPRAPERLPQIPVTSTTDRSQDPQLREAMKKAQATLDTFVARLQNPKRGETFSIEAAFKAEDNSPVYLWLGDVKFDKGSFTGIVTNHPRKATAFGFGDPATVAKRDVSDWMILNGGRTEGGFTIDILMKREGAPR